MIEKKLINFKKEADYQLQKEAGNIKPTSIVFIDDTKKIVTHNTEFDCSFNKDEFASKDYVDNKIDKTLGNLDKILDYLNDSVGNIDEILDDINGEVI